MARLLATSLCVAALSVCGCRRDGPRPVTKSVLPLAYDATGGWFDTDADAVRVACVGDSITYGMGCPEDRRDADSYPAQLQALLGHGYHVGNFGHTGTCVARDGTKPYLEQDEARAAEDFDPDIVVVMLGTNDVWDMNWHGTFAEDYERLLERYDDADEVICVTPPTLFTSDWGGHHVSDMGRVSEVRRDVLEIAQAHGFPAIDVGTSTDKLSTAFPDGLHPDPAGYGLIASIVAEEIEAGHR